LRQSNKYEPSHFVTFSRKIPNKILSQSFIFLCKGLSTKINFCKKIFNLWSKIAFAYRCVWTLEAGWCLVGSEHKIEPDDDGHALALGRELELPDDADLLLKRQLSVGEEAQSDYVYLRYRYTNNEFVSRDTVRLNWS
jgi:hypothetical protein